VTKHGHKSMTHKAILAQLAAAFGVNGEKARQAYPRDVFADETYAGWVRNWDRYMTLLGMEPEARGEVLDLVVELLDPAVGRVLPNIGAVTAFEVVCSILEVGQKLDAEWAVGEVERALADAGKVVRAASA
jgi:hypothetical protein